MSAPTVSPASAEPTTEIEINDLLTAVGVDRIRRNRHGQWCTKDVYGGWQPHGSYEDALTVVDRDDIT